MRPTAVAEATRKSFFLCVSHADLQSPPPGMDLFAQTNSVLSQSFIGLECSYFRAQKRHTLKKVEGHEMSQEIYDAQCDCLLGISLSLKKLQGKCLLIWRIDCISLYSGNFEDVNVTSAS